MDRRPQWELEMRLGKAFENLGEAVESVRGISSDLFVLRALYHPDYEELWQRAREAKVAVEDAYAMVIRDPQMPHEGEGAIKEYCERMGYSDNVLEGGLDYLIPAWERSVKHIEGDYGGTVDEYIALQIGVREIIYEVWPLISLLQETLYWPRLEEADRRFFAATKLVEESFSLPARTSPDRYPPNIYWWYYRVPRHKKEVWYW